MLLESGNECGDLFNLGTCWDGSEGFILEEAPIKVQDHAGRRQLRAFALQKFGHGTKSFFRCDGEPTQKPVTNFRLQLLHLGLDFRRLNPTIDRPSADA